MSLKPTSLTHIPAATATTARAAFPKGNPYLRLIDSLGPLFSDEQFADLFATRGRAAHSPARLALVTIFQFVEGLADHQAADAVRSRIDWKYALALELDDPGFDATVLVDFRARLVEGGAEATLFETLLERARQAGVLTKPGRVRTDATHVLGRLRDLNRLELVGESVRHALEAVAVVAPDWLRSVAEPDWYERYERRIEAYRLPKGREAWQALAETYGRDGMRLLEAISTAPEWLRQVPAVEVLRRVWVQQFYVIDNRLRWRKAADLPPASVQIASPYETEARYGKKRETEWQGYKVHLSETCDDEAPHLIIDVQTTTAAVADVEVQGQVLAQLGHRDLLPDEQLADQVYLSARRRVEAEQLGVRVTGPVARDTSWQAQAGHGYDAAQFRIEWEQQRAVCPQGEVSATWRERTDASGKRRIQIRFAAETCRACPARASCTSTTQGGRALTLQPRAEHEALEAARREQQQEAFWSRYAARAGIEGTLSQGIRRGGMRQARYRGLAKTRLQMAATASAINLVRIADWLGGVPRGTTRRSHFARLNSMAA